MEFSSQESWSGLPFPSPGDLFHPGVKPGSLMSLALQADSLPPEPAGEWYIEQDDIKTGQLWSYSPFGFLCPLNQLCIGL